MEKVVVVTGGFGALGRAALKVAREEGWKPVVVDYAAAPQSDQLSIGGVDLSEPAAAARAMAAARDAAGGFDALLNIAGGFAWETVADGSAATWDRMYALNLKTALNASKAALPYLVQSEGAIVNVGALGAVKAGAGMGAYAASKQAVMKLTESMAEELKGKVRVNAVLPSILDTEANRREMPSADFSAWVQPESLARVMLFLASDAARDVTGALLPVTGRV